jgi:hypothetical protein
MHSWRIEWNVADRDGHLIGTIDGSGGEISWDGNARIQRVCRGTIFNRSQWRDLNPFADWLVPVFVEATGQRTRLGLFAVLDLPVTYLDATEIVDPQPYLADGGVILDQPAPQSVAGLLNERLSDTMRRVVDLAGVGRYQIASTAEYIGEPIVEATGNPFASTMGGLCRLANFLPPHFDRFGVLQARPVPSLDDAPDVTYDSTSILAESRTHSDNLLEAPNVYVVVGTGASKSEIVAVSEVPVSSPNSVANRGRQVVKIIREQGLSSVVQAEQLAATYAASSLDTFGVVEFSTLPNPAHDCYNLVAVNGVTYREREWSMSLEPGGTMEHRVSRGAVQER